MAMWNLNGDDLQRAKEELKGRRAAIQARYENELKQLEVDIADLETFESFAVKFVSDFKGEDAPPPKAAEPAPAAVDVVAEIVGEQSSAAGEDAAVAQGAEAESAAGPERTPGQKNSSRWRMRLNTGEAAP